MSKQTLCVCKCMVCRHSARTHKAIYITNISTIQSQKRTSTRASCCVSAVSLMYGKLLEAHQPIHAIPISIVVAAHSRFASFFIYLFFSFFSCCIQG